MLWIYLLIGFITGLLSGLIGVGGGFILIPLLLLVHVPLEAAVSASLVFIFFSAGSGALRHGFQGTVDWRLGTIVTLSTIVTTVLGSLLTARVPGKILQILLGFCVVAGIYLINRKSTVAANPPDVKKPSRWAYTQTVRLGNRPVTYQVHVSKAVLVGGGVGFLTGLLGVGGGFLKVPAFVGFMQIPLRVAIGTSLMTILISAVVGAFSHWGQGNFDPAVVWTTTGAGIIGAQLGAVFVPRLMDRSLKRLLNCILSITAAYLFLRAAEIL